MIADLARKKKEVKMKIKRLRMITNPAPYRQDQIDSETKILSDVKNKIHTIEKNYGLIEHFSEILSIKEFKQMLDTNEEISNVERDKLTKSNEILFI